MLTFSLAIDVKKSFSIFVIWGALCASLLTLSSPAHANVTKKFNTARKLFEKRRYKQSEKVLKSIIRQYPSHKASYYLLGRIAYKFGKTKKAARLFLKSGPAFLFTGGAFEYGLTMFTIKKYNLAVKGLRKVSRRSPNKGIANFYTGVSYYNQRNYAKAVYFLQTARRLPQTLERSRRLFLKQAQKQRNQERAGRYSPQRPVYVPPPARQQYTPYYQLPGGQPPPLPPGAGAPPQGGTPSKEEPKKEKPAPPPAPSYGYSSTMTPRLEYSRENRVQDKHSFGRTENNIQGISGGIAGNLQYDMRSGTSYTLGLDVGFQNRTTTTANFVNQFADEDRGTIVATREDSDPVFLKNSTLRFTPGLNLPFGKSINLNASFNLLLTMPENRFAEATQQRTPAGSLQLTFDDITIDAGASMLELVDAEGVTTDQKTDFTGSLSKPFDTITTTLNFGLATVSKPAAATIGGFEQRMTIGGTVVKNFESMSATVTATNLQNTPPSGQVVAGTQASNTVNVELAVPFDFGISLTGGVRLVMIDQFIAALSVTPEGAEEATTVNVSATGQTQGFYGTVNFAPISWAYIRASYSHDETTFAIGNKERAQDFQKNTPDFVDATTFAIGVSQAF